MSMNKMSQKIFLMLALISFFLMCGLSLKLWATTYCVYDDGDNLDTTDIEGSWSWGAGANTVQNETAEGTGNAVEIDAGTVSYTCSDEDGSDWSGCYVIAPLYMGMWIYSNDSSGTDTLDIIITEEDDDGLNGGGPGVDQTWDLTTPISLDWTGWRYQYVTLPSGTTANDFTPSANPDEAIGDFNPGPVDDPLNGWAAKGVESIQMALTNNSGNNSSIYVDRIALSPGDATVSQIFPTDDVQADGKTTPDITLDRAPYTISAVLSGAEIANALNRISIVHSNDSDNLLNTVANTEDDGVRRAKLL
ncbi:hypothetical protein KAW55_07995, partial [bacterium]|nr:hypothetical protein [bacterium]